MQSGTRTLSSLPVLCVFGLLQDVFPKLLFRTLRDLFHNWVAPIRSKFGVHDSLHLSNRGLRVVWVNAERTEFAVKRLDGTLCVVESLLQFIESVYIVSVNRRPS